MLFRSGNLRKLLIKRPALKELLKDFFFNRKAMIPDGNLGYEIGRVTEMVNICLNIILIGSLTFGEKSNLI